MADIKEFEDTFTDPGTGEDVLTNRNLELPSGDLWFNTRGGSATYRYDKDNDYAFDDSDPQSWDIYQPDTTNYSLGTQYAQALVRSSLVTNSKVHVGVACRSFISGLPAGAIIGVLRGGATKKVSLYVRTDANTFTLDSQSNFTWSADTDYVIRLEVEDLTANQIECNIYVDDGAGGL